MSNIYKQNLNRKQQQFFPPSIDEYVSDDNPVRAIEDYVELLDMVKLGFTKAALVSTDGQPAYHPKLLLKIYIYGYLNKIRSSRKLESEIKRNIEMMWLCAGLKPSYKTIADFRKENSKALKKVFREFVLLCKELDLITGEIVAIDGAFLRANASKNQLITKKTVVKDLKEIDQKIEAYLEAMRFADSQEKKEKSLKPPANHDLAQMKKRKAKLDKDLALLEEMGVTQYNRTDPDAKVMKKPAHNLMAYNTQIVVDDTFKFIVATKISSQSKDFNHLYPMAQEVKEILKKESLTIVGDMGYHSAIELKKCIDENISVYTPIPKSHNPQKETGRFTQDKFRYEKEKDRYICPNNKILSKAFFTQKRGERINFVYRGTSAMCNACALRDNCLPQKTATKSIYRWEHQEIIEQHHNKMKTDDAKKIIKKRGSIVEHPFGTIKQTLGWSHFLVRGKKKVSGENALIMFTYNFRRLLNLIGLTLFQKLIKAIKRGDIEAIRTEIAEYITHFRVNLLYYLEYMDLLGFKNRKPSISV